MYHCYQKFSVHAAKIKLFTFSETRWQIWSHKDNCVMILVVYPDRSAAPLMGVIKIMGTMFNLQERGPLFLLLIHHIT
jgi:hypothetical protein